MRTSHTKQVRFHEQVRVKRIKPTGKNKSLYKDDSEDDSEDGEEDGFFEEDGAEVDEMEWSGDDENEEMEGSEDDDDDDINEEISKPGSRQTMERLKHDLFAEEEEETQDGQCP